MQGQDVHALVISYDMHMDIFMDMVSMKTILKICVAIGFIMRKEHRHEHSHAVYVGELGRKLGQVVQDKK